MCSFHIFLSKFVCHGNAVCFIENSGSILLFADPKNPQLKFLDFLHRTEISAILADVCLNSVAVVTFSDSLKIPIIYVNSLTPKILLLLEKFLSILHRSEICAILACFWLP